MYRERDGMLKKGSVETLTLQFARGSSVSAMEKLHCQGDPPVCIYGFNIGIAGGYYALVIHV